MLRRMAVTMMLALAAAGILAGCNTMRGVGRDVERGFEHTRDAVFRR
jgi:predicted small secreted protein